MKTFRESLVWSAFNGEWPPFLSAQERADYWERCPHPEMSRARALGLAFRAGRWTAADVAEFNRLAEQPDSFDRHQADAEEKTANSRMFG